jgi:hypothetical protein
LLEIQADVHGTGGMRERADGDKIHAGLGDGAHGGEINAATGFGLGTPFALLHSETQLHEGHVVEQYEIRAGGRALLDLFERVGFDFNLELRIFCARLFDGGGDSVRLRSTQSSEVIVLDENHVEQAEAKVDAAAAGDSVFFQSSQTGGGFACVENPRVSAFDGIHELHGQGGNAGEALNEIEGNAFSAQDGARVAGNSQ